jgi:hypothetical protein
MLDGLPMWIGQGLDYYQAHWYDPMASGNWCARCTDYATVKARYKLDGPLVIGEFFGGASVDAAQRYADFYAKGYAGAWAWSLFTDHTSDKLDVDLIAAKTFASNYTDTGPSARGTPLTVAPAPPDKPVAFVMGFAAFRERVGEAMGSPLENEHGTAANCDTVQQTTTGLAYWRCSTNSMTFAALPDGLHHWALLDGNLIEWVGPTPDPPVG